MISLSIVQLPERVATAQARAPSEPDISHCHASVALACNAPSTSAESHPIPESVATAERISPRFALLIVPLHSIIDSIFLPSAQEPMKAQSHRTHTLLPSHPVFGGSL